MAHPLSSWSAFIAALSFATTLPTPSSFARADTVSAPPALEPAQMAAFAALVSEPESSVRQRLSTEPTLIPLAQAAAEARLRRKHTGRVLTITGLVVLGVGTALGIAMVQAGGRPVNCPQGGPCDGGNAGLIGVVVIGVSNAVGLALAIPGIVKMARESQIETTVSTRYHSAVAPIPANPPSAFPVARPALGLTVPLLSGTF